MDFEHPTFQGASILFVVESPRVSLRLPWAFYVFHWVFIDIIGCGSAIQASLIAFALHGDSARPC